MSQENVETLRGAVEASQRVDAKDVSAMLEILDPDCVYELPAELFPDPEWFRGHDGFRRQWSQYMDLWEDGTFSVVTEQYIDAGDRVVLLTRHRGRTKHGMDVDMPVAYVVTFRDAKVVHRGRQHKESFRTLAEAREAKGRRAAGESKPPSRWTFEEYAREWIGSYRGRTRAGISETSRSDYRHSLERDLIPFFGGYRLSQIEPPDVRRLVRMLGEKDLSRSSIKKRIATLSALLATAVEDGELRHNPAREVRIGGAGRDPIRKRAMTRDQLGALLHATPPKWRLFVELLAHTGLRISEAVGLRWSDVDFGRRRLNVTSQVYKGERKVPKSQHGVRWMPLSPAMTRRLWKARAASDYRGDDDPVFPATNGAPLRPHNVHDRVIKPAAREAGLRWVSAHTLRHTCASLLFEAGKNPKQVQAWLGHHASGYTVDTYVHLLDGGLGEADFLDHVVQVRGNRRATEGPGTVEEEEAPMAADSAT